MEIQSRTPPYFNRIIDGLADGDDGTMAAFGRHVHWGYWEKSPAAICTPQEFGEAAECLSRIVCDTAEIQDGARIVDVGCGFGGTIASLNERFLNLRLTGINVDSRQIARAREGVLAVAGNSIEFVQAMAAEIPLPDKSCDVVLAVESAFHFDRPRFFAEVARLLKPTGNLTISDFVISEKASNFLQGFNLFSDAGIRNSYGDVDLSWTIQRYRELADRFGLTITESIDITANTLPTYPFLYAHSASLPAVWQDPDFLQATRLLEKASRKGLMNYQILKFARS